MVLPGRIGHPAELIVRTLLLALMVGLFLIAAVLFTFAVGPLVKPGAPAATQAFPASALPETVVGTAGKAPLWLRRVNDLRSETGLQLVVEEPERSAMAAAHVQYMLLNVLDEGFWHGETEGRPGYSPAGHQAALNSNLAWVENMLLSPAEAVTIWQNSPEHLERMLAPGLQQVGFALACNRVHCAAALYVGP